VTQTVYYRGGNFRNSEIGHLKSNFKVAIAKFKEKGLHLQPKPEITMLIINVKENESIDKALKRFKEEIRKNRGFEGASRPHFI